MRSQGSLMTVHLEALMPVKESKTSTNATAVSMSMHPPVEGQKPHECIFGTHYYDETERKGLVNPSESGNM